MLKQVQHDNVPFDPFESLRDPDFLQSLWSLRLSKGRNYRPVSLICPST